MEAFELFLDEAGPPGPGSAEDDGSGGSADLAGARLTAVPMGLMQAPQQQAPPVAALPGRDAAQRQQQQREEEEGEEEEEEEDIALLEELMDALEDGPVGGGAGGGEGGNPALAAMEAALEAQRRQMAELQVRHARAGGGGGGRYVWRTACSLPRRVCLSHGRTPTRVPGIAGACACAGAAAAAAGGSRAAAEAAPAGASSGQPHGQTHLGRYLWEEVMGGGAGYAARAAMLERSALHTCPPGHTCLLTGSGCITVMEGIEGLGWASGVGWGKIAGVGGGGGVEVGVWGGVKSASEMG